MVICLDEKNLLENSNQYYEELQVEKEKLKEANEKITSLQKKLKYLKMLWIHILNYLIWFSLIQTLK